jgi:peptidyl-prolyl cis-trans isomerase SurA
MYWPSRENRTQRKRMEESKIRHKKVIAVRMITVTALFVLVPRLSCQTLIDRIVAVVDKEIITESELAERASFLAAQSRMDPTTPDFRRQVLDALVAEKLILAQAMIDSIEVTEEQVTQTLDQQVQNLVRQVGSQERVEQLYGKPINRIKREYRDEIKKQLLVQKVRQSREANLSVTHREAEEFFAAYKDSLPQVPDEYELSHLYIVPKADSLEEQKTKAKLVAVLDSIKAGGDFADFAKRYSNDGTAATGGDLGWAKRGDYVHEFEETVFSLHEGELSGIVKTQFGFHIMQLLGRRGESVHVRHILLRIAKGAASDSQCVQQLRNLKARVMKGEPFAELAQKYSEDEDTKALGGDLGSITSDQLVPEFAGLVKELKPGEISEPTRATMGAAYGYHIVWLRKKTPAHAMSIQVDEKRIEQLALYMKRNKLNSEWLDKLKKTIYVDIRM